MHEIIDSRGSHGMMLFRFFEEINIFLIWTPSWGEFWRNPFYIYKCTHMHCNRPMIYSSARPSSWAIIFLNARFLLGEMCCIGDSRPDSHISYIFFGFMPESRLSFVIWYFLFERGGCNPKSFSIVVPTRGLQTSKNDLRMLLQWPSDDPKLTFGWS